MTSPPDLNLLPFPIRDENGQAQGRGNRQAGLIAEPTAKLPGLRVQGRIGIGGGFAMRPHVQPQLVEELANHRKKTPAPRQAATETVV